jgi:hypothetical protein
MTGSFLKPREAFFKETFSQHADNFTGRIKSICNFIIAEPLGGKENHLGTRN